MNRSQRRAGLAFARNTASEWHPFEKRFGAEDARPYLENSGDIRACYLNNRYSVQHYARRMPDGREAMHLCIRRHDGGTTFPWADLQRIKSELAGPQRVAVEVFPAESELVDNANLRHLFVLPDGDQAPFSIKGHWS